MDWILGKWILTLLDPSVYCGWEWGIFWFDCFLGTPSFVSFFFPLSVILGLCFELLLSLWALLICLFKTPLCWNIFPQILHSVFLPVCNIIWRGIDPCFTCFPQIEQITFGIVWFFRWRSRAFWVINFLPQSTCTHVKYSTCSACVLMCFSKLSLALYWAPQR